MNKIFSVLVALMMTISLLPKTVFAAPMLPAQTELGQLKVCKVAGSDAMLGKLFTFRVGGNSYNIPAGHNPYGFCVLAGQYPLNTKVTVEEVIPDGYYVSDIDVKPGRSISRNEPQGIVVIQVGPGVTEVIYTNDEIGSPTPSSPPPTKTSTPTPGCAPNCTPTATSIPQGRMQICKEADGAGVSGYFAFQFDDRKRVVPVGACAGMISVKAGNLTITELAQPGYTLTDVYTIPANRLVSKNLKDGSAIVKIVQGGVSSQTIVVFRNRAVSVTATPTNTPTSTATSTPTGGVTPTFTPTSTPTGGVTPTFTPTGSVTPTATTPPSVCPPSVIYADFSGVPMGASVEGLGAVAPYLNIDAKGTAVKVQQATDPIFYYAPNGSPDINGGLSGNGGFSDLETKTARQPHLYNFTFAPGVTVTNFSLHMLDYADWNPSLSTSHYASLTAYDAGGNVVSKEEVSFETLAQESPRSSSLYGDLWITGDAATAPLGQPGNWIWNVSGNGIVRVVLEFGVGYDPNVAFDLLYFTTECASCQSVFSTDFSGVAAGQSVEGLGAVAPYLNIDAKGTAVKVQQATDPIFYYAPNGSPDINGGLSGNGGFSDLETKTARQPHLYNFTFAPGVTVTNFSLHMLDYADWNPSLSTSHYASLTAYDAGGNVVSKEEVSFETLAQESPRSSSLYGDLWITGDAATAPLGQPGNWIWNVSGNGIVRVVLEFGVGYDPNVAFDLLYFGIVCQ